MKVNVQQIFDKWDIGYSLDKHSISSVFIGNNEYGHPTFNTTRTEVGEALYQLKYNADHNKITMLAKQIVDSLGNYFQSATFIMPMPPSKPRTLQPVKEIAKQVSILMDITYNDNVLEKTSCTDQMKNISSKEERVKTLCSAFKVNDVLADGKYNVLIMDDLYDTGSSLEAATITLKQYTKINKIFVATVTRNN